MLLAHGTAQLETVDAGHLGELERRVFETGDDAVFIHGDQPGAYFDGAGVDHPALFNDGDLARAAADVDVHDREIAALMIGHMHRAGTVSRQDRLQVMPSRGADEFPRFGGKQRGDRFGIFLFHRFAGNDDRTGVDVLRRQPGDPIGFMNEIAQLVGVDGRLVDIGGQQDRRLMDNLAVDHDESRGQRHALAPQGQSGKDQM